VKFGTVATTQAVGAVLAHSVRTLQRAYKKGRVLSASDIDDLIAANIESLLVARLDDNDVPENEAAEMLAQASCDDSLQRSAAFTGRVNLYALSNGLALIDAQRVSAINAVHESLTIATLAPFTPVATGQMIATIKVIPYAVPRTALQEALAIASSPIITLAPFAKCSVGLIATRLAQTSDNVLNKGVNAVSERVMRLGSVLSDPQIVLHETQSLTAALHRMLGEGHDVLLIAGIIATVDRDDIVPAAIKKLGGEVTYYGMPVDPGNLLLLGHIGSTPVVGVPSCARSPKLNGFDFVLQRLLAKLPVGAREIASMGVGGLLSEISSRPMPRDSQPVLRAPRIAAIILAAGTSSRMGGRHKVLIEIDGKPMVLRAVEAARIAGLSPMIVVTGAHAERVQRGVSSSDVIVAHNPDYASGLASSLRVGLQALSSDIDGAAILLADMPSISATHLQKLLAAFSPDDQRAIVVPTHGDRWGNPMIWARRFFADMQSLQGDRGARALAQNHQEFVVEVPLDNAVLLDIDRPEDLEETTHSDSRQR
jgi:molybdenum cofactor cytidylyltransferase